MSSPIAPGSLPCAPPPPAGLPRTAAPPWPRCRTSPSRSLPAAASPPPRACAFQPGLQPCKERTARHEGTARRDACRARGRCERARASERTFGHVVDVLGAALVHAARLRVVGHPHVAHIAAIVGVLRVALQQRRGGGRRQGSERDWRPLADRFQCIKCIIGSAKIGCAHPTCLLRCTGC